jgi:hypothetical protein
MKRIMITKLFGVSVAVLLMAIPVFLKGQTTSNGEMPQYLYPGFTKCDVLMKSGQTNSPVMNYNTVSQKMVFISNEKFYDLTNPELVDTIFLNGHKFVPVGKAFYEVLVSKPIALFIQHKGNLMTAGKPVGYGGTSQTASANYISNIELSGLQYNIELPSNYIVNPVPSYWIRSGTKWSDFQNEKQFISLFPDKTAEIKSFIKGNRIKIDKPEDLSKLVRFCATLQ